MRIIHLLASPWWTGPAETIATLALAQRQLGHEVHVAVDTLRTDAPSEEPIAPRLRALGLLDDGGLVLSVKGSLSDTWGDLRRLRGRKLDVVHSHFSHDHWVARWGKPRGARLVRSLHAPRSLRRLTPRADAWTVPFEGMLHSLVGRRAMVLPALIAPGFTPAADQAALRSSLGLEGEPLIGLISTFQPSRRHALALEAFAKLHASNPRARLLLVGDGALGPALREQAAELGLSQAVRFDGYQSGDDFVKRLQSLDEVWILGLGNDWSARAAAQAKACGVRVVAVDEGALSRWADELVPPEVDALCQASGGEKSELLRVPETLDVARAVLRLYA